ncbi:MAG TPA: UDP-N-acetylmuramoyl-L-alanine--D-glutamate ligase, partial [Candidatus Sumerlaeota bacterium]|nr:UDP-N-acetylmuramoyl-L-alanine--D-glutamate ligase [Candidatus Sumerlaeota bacterium]
MTKIRPFPYSRVCVFGAARSGVGAMHLLRHHNIEVTLVDERPAMEFRSLIRRLRRSYVTAHFGPIKEDVLRGCQAIVLSPGIPLTHPLVQQAMDRDLPIISEVELASYFACAPIVAITGTNGKT